MIAAREKQDTYFSAFGQLERKAGAPAWLRAIRKDAIGNFAELGFPNPHLEAWKYTSVAPIASIPFSPAGYRFSASIAEKIARLPLANLDCCRIVFINGYLCRELSSDFPHLIRVSSLAEALGTPLVEQHLAAYAHHEDHAFTALNTALFQNGAFVEVPKGIVLEKPVCLLFISSAGGPPAVSHPRNLILGGRESQFAVIEGHVGLGPDAAGGAAQASDRSVYFTNAVTEIVAGENAVINYFKVQQEDERAFHVATLQVEQARNSNVSTSSLAFGAALAREEINAVLNGEGAQCALNGLYVTTGRQHVDNHTTIDHAQPHCSSRELYKGVLDGQSTGVFNGRIVVRKDAQKTDSKQSNKNLMLSEDCVIHTKPQLEIYADDVKCTHGATIGQIDAEAIFYLRSRGIGRQEARSMLTYAFANDVIERIKHAPLAARLRDALLARLERGV